MSNKSSYPFRILWAEAIDDERTIMAIEHGLGLCGCVVRLNSIDINFHSSSFNVPWHVPGFGSLECRMLIEWWTDIESVEDLMRRRSWYERKAKRGKLEGYREDFPALPPPPKLLEGPKNEA
jgi:hypothetical protein